MASSSSSDVQGFGDDVKSGDKNLWTNLSLAAKNFLLSMSVFIISIKPHLEDIDLWNSYFIKTLRFWGMKIKVLSNPCVPHTKTVPDTGATFVGDAVLRGLCASEAAWVKLSASPQSLGVLGSHLNVWYEALLTSAGPYTWVLEEDVHAHDNSITFLLEFADIMTGKHKKCKGVGALKMVHFVHGENQHRFVQQVVNAPTVAQHHNIYLQCVPLDGKGKPEMCGTGFRSYIIHEDLMRKYTSLDYKWFTWCDMQAPGVLSKRRFMIILASVALSTRILPNRS